MKTHYFTVTDEDGRTAGIIKASNSKELESLLMDLTLEHHVLDDTELKNSLNINDFIGNDKTVTVKGIIDTDEEPIYYDMRLESCLLYGSPSVYQVQNKAGNPASSENNPDAVFLKESNANTYKEFLHEECGIDMRELKVEKF